MFNKIIKLFLDLTRAWVLLGLVENKLSPLHVSLAGAFKTSEGWLGVVAGADPDGDLKAVRSVALEFLSADLKEAEDGSTL